LALLRNSACISWLERDAEEGGLLAQGALLALAGEGRITELGGIEGLWLPLTLLLGHRPSQEQKFSGLANRLRSGPTSVNQV